MTWPSASSRAHTTTTSATEPLPIQRFAPSMTYSSPSRRTRVSSATESEPWSGSVRANAPVCSTRAMPGQPALALLLGAEQVDRSHRQAGLHAEERAEAAVAAVDLHVDEAPGERAHPRAAVALDAVADQAELAEAAEQRPRRLGALPVVVDHRKHLLVDEAPRAQEVVPLLVGELLADEEVVGRQRGAEVLVGHASWPWLSSRGRRCRAPCRAHGGRAPPSCLGAGRSSPERSPSQSA